MTRFSRILMLLVIVVGALYIAKGEVRADEPKAPWERDDGVVVSHTNTQGTAEQRAIDFCKERGSERLSLQYNSETITVVCRDDPQTSYTFVR